MRKFHETTGRRPIFFHTVSIDYYLCIVRLIDASSQSGTGMLVEPAEGEYATETVYSDVDVAQLKSIPDAALHKSIDVAIIAADQEGTALSVTYSYAMFDLS